MSFKTSEQGKNLITLHESFRERSYQDSVGKWTVGYGHTATAKPNMVITKEIGNMLLSSDLAAKESCVSRNVNVLLTQNQFDALTSLAFNIGCGNFASSTLLKKLNSGDMQGAADQFLVWNRAGGKVLDGLKRRRADERALFLSPTAKPSKQNAIQKTVNTVKNVVTNEESAETQTWTIAAGLFALGVAGGLHYYKKKRA